MPWGQGGFGSAAAAAPGLLIRPSGDTGGTTDTANVASALATLAGPGAVYLAPGAFYMTGGGTTINAPGRYIIGSGQFATIVNGVGSGDIIRMFTTSQYVPGSSPLAGGGVLGVTFDGRSMGAASSGWHAGDIYNLYMDVGARNFTGAGSKGIWLDNNYHWAEQATGKIWAENCSACVQFDLSTNISGAATGSFDRACLDIFLNMNDKGNGVIFNGGAILVDGRLGIYGNASTSALAGAPFSVLTLTGQNTGSSTANNFSQINNSILNIGVELDDTVHTLPVTITFGTAVSNNITACSGNIDFGASLTFANAVNFNGSFQFDGPALGDLRLMRSANIGQNPFEQGALISGGLITTRFTGVTRCQPAGAVTGCILQGFPPDNCRQITVINAGAGSITFDVPGTSHVADGTSDVIGVNQAAAYVWSQDDNLWYRHY